MEEKIRQGLLALLCNAADGQAKTEVVDELTANLTERYRDLRAQGVSEEEAYRRVMEGVGDVSEIVSLLNANAGQRQSVDFTAAFQGFENKLRDLAHDLEGPMRDAAESIKSAARAAKEPIMDMGRTVVDTVKNLEISVNVRDEHRFDYTIPGQDITGLDIRLRAGDAIFGFSENDDIYVVERSIKPLAEDKHVSFSRREDGVLCIEQSNSAVSMVFFGFGMLSSDLEIYLPRRHWESLSVSTITGDVTLEDGIDCSLITLKSTSGDVECRGLVCDAIRASSVSGDVELDAKCSEVDLSSISGDVEFTGAPNRAIAKTTSGEVELDLLALPESLELSSVSGGLRVTLPENDGFSIQYRKVSGDLKSDFGLMTSLNRQSGIAVYRDGDQRPPYRFSTTSGNIRIDRR